MKKKTFSLLELTVVLLLIGALTTLSITQYIDSQKLSKAHVFESNINEIQKALSTYKSNQVLLDSQTIKYPTSLSDPKFKLLFEQEPKNPYTGVSMLSDDPNESGIQYQSDGTSYSICIAQQDVDDINNNGRTDEPLPITLYPACTGTLPSLRQCTVSAAPNNPSYGTVTFSGTNTIVAVAMSKPNSAKQIINKQTSGTALFFHIRATGDTHVTVSLNEATLEVPVSTEWQKYAVVYDTPADTTQIQFSNLPVENNVYIRDVVLVDK